STPDPPPAVPPDDSTPFGPDGPAPPGRPPVHCDPSASVKASGPALLVRHPAVLSHFPLEKVIQQLIDFSTGANPITKEELLQRLFDTENSAATAVFADGVHCDSPGNAAFKKAPAVDCPRAEGVLAKSTGFFVPGHPDYFAPVALVNRFDLTSENADTC